MLLLVGDVWAVAQEFEDFEEVVGGCKLFFVRLYGKTWKMCHYEDGQKAKKDDWKC